MKDCRKPEREVERGRGEREREGDRLSGESLGNIGLLGVCVCVLTAQIHKNGHSQVRIFQVIFHEFQVKTH